MSRLEHLAGEEMLKAQGLLSVGKRKLYGRPKIISLVIMIIEEHLAMLSSPESVEKIKKTESPIA